MPRAYARGHAPAAARKKTQKRHPCSARGCRLRLIRLATSAENGGEKLFEAEQARRIRPGRSRRGHGDFRRLRRDWKDSWRLRRDDFLKGSWRLRRDDLLKLSWRRRRDDLLKGSRRKRCRRCQERQLARAARPLLE